MNFKRVVQLFRKGNVCVCGLRGTGKDVLMGNVIARRKEKYVSNMDYTQDEQRQILDFSKLDIGQNTYKNLIEGNVNYYEYPYEIGSDVYVSDAGIYMPAHYCNELNKLYPYLPTYFALSRQVSHNNFHINVQHLPRAWDKIREQSDLYIRCRYCYVIFGVVIQGITLYDKYQSCADRVKPCVIRVPFMAKKEVKLQARMYIDKFRNTYGSISNRFLIYRNRSKHDTYYFEKLFKGGKMKNEQKN